MPVKLEFNIVNKSYPEGKTSYNAIAEIAGTDKKDEVVMLGGHLDSWHAATGATDNAIGCAVMMEAARILKAIGVQPRRTIRVALWGGEEQGLLGSKAYVREHFGTFENPKPEFEKFAGYFNVDSGTGRIRGASVFGPPEAATILREVLAPFEDLGIMGASATTSRRSGGTDSTSFNEAGLPGIGLSQDPIEYDTYTWHTNLDTYERIIEDDVKKSAMAIAAAVYHLAMRDDDAAALHARTRCRHRRNLREAARHSSQTARVSTREESLMSENEVVEGSEEGTLTRTADYVGSTLGSATRAVSDTAQAAASTASSVASSVTSAASGAGDAVAGAASGAVKRAASARKAVKRTVKKTVKSATRAVKTTASRAKKAVAGPKKKKKTAKQATRAKATRKAKGGATKMKAKGKATGKAKGKAKSKARKKR